MQLLPLTLQVIAPEDRGDYVRAREGDNAPAGPSVRPRQPVGRRSTPMHSGRYVVDRVRRPDSPPPAPANLPSVPPTSSPSSTGAQVLWAAGVLRGQRHRRPVGAHTRLARKGLPVDGL